MVALWQDAESGVRVVRLTEATEIEALVRLFEAVAAAEGWQPEGALRRWQHRSVYFALKPQGEMAGGLQLVRPDASGTLPCQALWPEIPVDPAGGHAHVAILALEAASRGQGRLFWPLVVELWRYCVGVGIPTLWIEVTPRVLPLYQRLGWPLRIEGELRRHWGEECYLCSLGIPEVAEALLRRAEHSSYYRPIVAQAFRVTLPARKWRPRATASWPPIAGA
jgi:hypothetical protein